MQIDLEIHSRWKPVELRQETVDQAFQQPCTHGVMAGMFGEFVTRLKTHIGNVEPTSIDFGIRSCAAWPEFRPFSSGQYSVERVFRIVRGETPSMT
ncbi:hypothetical protein WL21_14440 [Burkholderia ubonensis]|nr:hypothetical protein WJ81_14915 [Burkholderia ubonensis]KVZ60956.1 hypothetical protein WL20_16860 [Burkholderia ubonensis]KVZ68363.1 hypothetical protein WL21_14440 [Burkholderia ubonensis]